MKQKIKIVKFLKRLENGAESHLYAIVSQDVEPIKEHFNSNISIMEYYTQIIIVNRKEIVEKS